MQENYKKENYNFFFHFQAQPNPKQSFYQGAPSGNRRSRSLLEIRGRSRSANIQANGPKLQQAQARKLCPTEYLLL